MRSVFRSLAELAQRFDGVLFPVHPRTANAMQRHNIAKSVLGKVTLMPPISGLESLAYQQHAHLVITDSGCVQEEAYILGVPCVTVRENTERHQTVELGANRLVGFDARSIKAGVVAALSSKERHWPPIYGRCGAGERIVDRLTELYRQPNHGWDSGFCRAQPDRGIAPEGDRMQLPSQASRCSVSQAPDH